MICKGDNCLKFGMICSIFFIKFVSQNRVFIAIYKKVRFIFNLIRFTKRAESVNPWNLIVSTSLNP